MICFARCILTSNCLGKYVFGPFRYILNIDCYELFPNGNWIVNGCKFYFPISYQSIDIWCFTHHNSCAFEQPNSCMKCSFVVKSQSIEPTIKTRNDWVPRGTTCYTNNEYEWICFTQSVLFCWDSNETSYFKCTRIEEKCISCSWIESMLWVFQDLDCSFYITYCLTTDQKQTTA